MTNTANIIERVRHELKFRIGTVVNAVRLTPRMVRVVVTSPDLNDFTSLAYDDHVKLFFPTADGKINMPENGPNGPQYEESVTYSPGRDYTPRYFDPANNSLTLDFVLHGDGPATSWAAHAKSGDIIGIGGPRGSFVVKAQFDWYLLIGDETALPAIGRRIEELDHGRILALIEVADENEQQAFRNLVEADIRWFAREADPSSTSKLSRAVAALGLPVGEGYAFVAGESSFSKVVRNQLIEKGMQKGLVKAAGYWSLAQANFDDGHEH